MIEFLRRLWPYVRPYKTRLFLGLICGVLFALSNGAMYGIVKLVVNELYPTADSQAKAVENFSKASAFIRPMLKNLASHLPHFNGSMSKNGLIVTICLIPMVMFFRSLFNYFNAYLVNWASARAIADLRTKTFA